MKVAIIGAGPVGLYLAWKLSEKGYSVFLFEKKDNLGEKACSGLFSERILEFLPKAKELIQNEINHCLIHFPQKKIKIIFKKKFFVIDRSKLILLLFELSKNSGAKIFFGKKINSIPEGFERIIGCDGANSIIRKKLGLKNPIFYLGIQGFLKKKDFSNFVEVFPTKNGFLWKIPRGEEIEYGIMEKPKKAKIIFENFLEKNNLSLERIRSAVIPQGFFIPKNEKITLCGDSTGLTKPWSGGGVIWGLKAANILLNTFPDFLKYEKEMRKFFKKQILFSKIAKKIIYFLGFKFPSFLSKDFKFDGDFITLSDIF